jgi:hypothetical protein
LKYIFLSLALFILKIAVPGQALKRLDSTRAKIYIIGVVHTENSFRNTDSLLTILKAIRPDLILSETDTLSGYFKSDYTLVEPPKWYKIARKLNAARKMPPEMDLLYRYKETDTAALVYPFDMPIPNRRKYVAVEREHEMKWVAALNQAAEKGLIPDSLSPFHQQFITYNNWFFEIGQSSYAVMNRTVTTDSIRGMVKIENDYFPRLLHSVQSLSAFKTWYAESNQFWVLRNETMSKNIIRFIEMTKPQKVVVLTGLLHKYYLTDLLNAGNKANQYELVEYFEK